MKDDEEDDHGTFFRMSLSGVRDGTPGFISDAYLNAISAETSVTSTELCMAGLWERDDERSGYVLHDPMVSEVVAFHERMEIGKEFCATTGGHEMSDESGPGLCAKCHAPLKDTGGE